MKRVSDIRKRIRCSAICIFVSLFIHQCFDKLYDIYIYIYLQQNEMPSALKKIGETAKGILFNYLREQWNVTTREREREPSD